MEQPYMPSSSNIGKGEININFTLLVYGLLFKDNLMIKLISFSLKNSPFLFSSICNVLYHNLILKKFSL